MADRPDYYLILGIHEGATASEVRGAYRRAARANHPDLNPHDLDAPRRFIQVQEAYEVLSDPHRRAAYRRPGASSPSAHRGPPRSARGATTAHPPSTIDPDLLEALLVLRALARRAQVERRLRRLVRYLEGL